MIMMPLLLRFSPYEWDNPHPCNDEAEVLVNEFSLCNSMWFTIGSLMQQGSDISPKWVSIHNKYSHQIYISCSQSHLYQDGGGHVVVLHPDHDQLLHRQPGSLPHRGEDGVSHRVSGGPGQADQDQVWMPGVRIHQSILQSKFNIEVQRLYKLIIPGCKEPNICSDEVLHGVTEGLSVHEE